MNFKEELAKRIEEIEGILKHYLPKEEGSQKAVLQAMNYSVLAGGKRLRPMLMQEAYRLFGGTEDIINPFMASLEMIHTYSLIHDDLPAMDNDEYRRGKKTTHVVYGEAIAILAGDGLLNYAFETAAGAFAKKPGDCRVEQAFSVLAKKAGVFGMIGGQTADIVAEGRTEPLTLEELLYIHENKTAALIQSALMIGALLAGAGKQQVLDMEKAGYDIGVAFQIQDDILDVTGDMEKLGKPIGSDEKNNKATYVTLVGLKQAEKEQERLSGEAVRLLEKAGAGSFFLELVQSLITRES
ncbi:MAG: polyprenyl synthetase family protein [Lachnospiraceae bacterium]|nr:polyprenyl synthetase family protein [Lachnospiraceae bacterium]